MATFVYYWKSPDNTRHEGEIEAADRDAAFVALRAQGIRAIKVEPKGWETGKGYTGVKKRVVFGVAIVAALVAGGIVYFALGRGGARVETTTVVMTPTGPVTSTIASPLPRQPVLGDHRRVENCPTNLFQFAAETALARFAEPGRPVDAATLTLPTEAEFRECLNVPIRIASNELTEYIDLKRIVTGMKRELRVFLDSGDSFENYVQELFKRQRTEVAYRERAESRLQELLKEAESAKENRNKAQGEAYAFWLKANAQLKSMGIYELPLPETLRTYQMSVGLDE